MDELRSEIRAAFEKEQVAHPPVAALRRNVVAAAIILGVLVVAGLMSTRFAHHASVPATPKASPVADYGPPPAGVHLLYVHDPNHQLWFIGYDWQGKPRGTVKLAQPLSRGESIGMSPDGQQFQVTFGKGGSGVFFDRLGHPVPGTPQLPPAGASWADDNRHLCEAFVDQKTFVWRLATQLPGEAMQSVAVLPRDPDLGQTDVSVAACSFRNDLAILVRTTISLIPRRSGL